MRNLLDEVTAEDALPSPSQDRKPIGIYVPGSPLTSFSPDPSSPRRDPRELWRDVNGGEGPLSQKGRPRRQIEPKLYTLFPENCPVTCECRGNLMPGHTLTNMIDEDNLVNKLPLAPPPVQTTLYYDVPDLERYHADKEAAKKAKPPLETRSKSKSKRNRGSVIVKEESPEPEIHYTQLQRPARGYIPVKSLLGPFDFDTLEPAPPKARILTITISPSTAASTLPTPPLTADSTSSESHAASAGGSTTSPHGGGTFEQHLTSPESEPMIIDPPSQSHEENPPPSDIDLEDPPQITIEHAPPQLDLLPPIDMADLPELPAPSISAQDPLPFGFQPARHWDAPADMLGPTHASNSEFGASNNDFWAQFQPGNAHHSQLSQLTADIMHSFRAQGPVTHPQFPEYPPGLTPRNSGNGAAPPAAQLLHQFAFPPADEVSFAGPSMQANNVPLSLLDASSFPPSRSLRHSSPFHSPTLRLQEHPQTSTNPLQVETRQNPPSSTPNAGATQQGGPWGNSRVPTIPPIRGPSKSPSNKDTSSRSKYRPPTPTKPGLPSSTNSRMKEDTAVAGETKDKKGKKRFTCKVSGCPATFTRRNDADRHANSAAAHRDYAQEWADMQKSEGSQAPALSPFRCEKCNRLLSRADAAKRHMAKGSCGKRELPSEQVIARKRDIPRR